MAATDTSVTIITNGHERELLNFYDLTDKERKDFDYVESFEEYQSYRFFRYKGNVYDTHDCEVSHDLFGGWSGYFSDSFFSGVLFKFVMPDMETVKVGRYYS